MNFSTVSLHSIMAGAVLTLYLYNSITAQIQQHDSVGTTAQQYGYDSMTAWERDRNIYGPEYESRGERIHTECMIN